MTLLSGCDILKTLPDQNNTSVSEQEAGKGIKEALNQGLEKAVAQLNRKDGFFGNEFALPALLLAEKTNRGPLPVASLSL